MSTKKINYVGLVAKSKADHGDQRGESAGVSNIASITENQCH